MTTSSRNAEPPDSIYPPGRTPAGPPVGWVQPVEGRPRPSTLRITGSVLALAAGVAGLVSAFLPYVSYGEEPAFSLVQMGATSGSSIAFALEPLILAGAVLVLGVVGLVVRSRLLAGLGIGLGAALMLNHGTYLLSVTSLGLEIDGHAQVGMYVGLAAGISAFLGGLFLALDRGSTQPG